MSTLLLSHDDHDLMADAYGNIAMASTPYAYSQDVATASLMFKGEHVYYGGVGIPYFQEILGHRSPISIIKGHYEKAALSVQGISRAEAVLTTDKARGLNGEIRCSTVDGENITIGL